MVFVTSRRTQESRLPWLRVVTLAAGAMTLSGCLGGGGAGTEGFLNTTDESAAEAAANFSSFQDSFAALNGSAAALTPTAPGALPTSGAARYDGVVRIANAESTIHGEMRLDVGFAESRVSGAFDNLRNEAIPIRGTVRIGEVGIDRTATGSEPAFRAPISGQNLNFDTTFNDIEGQVRGDFADNGRAVILTGTASVSPAEFDAGGSPPAPRDWGVRAVGAR